MLLPSKLVLSTRLPHGDTLDRRHQHDAGPTDASVAQHDLARFQVFVPPFRFALVEQGVYRGGYPRPRNVPHLCQLKLRTLLSLTPDPLPDSVASALTTGQGETSNAYPLQCLHIHVPKPKEDQVPLDAALALKVLTALVLDPSRHPMYIHCLDGQLVTGSLIMALRKAQGWSVQASIAEFQRCIRGEAVPSEIAEFIQKLGGELDFLMPGARSLQALDAVVTSGLSCAQEPMAQDLVYDSSTSPPPTPPVTIAATPDASIHLAPVPSWFWGGSVPFRKHPHSSLKLKLPPIVPCPTPHILALVGPLEVPVATQDSSTPAMTAPSTTASVPSGSTGVPGSSPPTVLPISSIVPAVLTRSSSANAHENGPLNASTPISGSGQPATQQPTPSSAPTPSQTLKDIKARLLTDFLLGMPTVPSATAEPNMPTPAGVGGISGLGILMAAATATGTAGSASNSGNAGGGGNGLQGGGGGVGAATAAAIAAGLGPVVHQESDDALLDDLDDADDDDVDGDEVNLSRMVQALNLEGLSG